MLSLSHSPSHFKAVKSLILYLSTPLYLGTILTSLFVLLLLIFSGDGHNYPDGQGDHLLHLTSVPIFSLMVSVGWVRAEATDATRQIRLKMLRRRNGLGERERG